MTFEEAYKRLQEIHGLLQSNNLVDIEKLIALQEEAKTCYDLCSERLKKLPETN